MSHDVISLDPAKAAAKLHTVQKELFEFNNDVYEVGFWLRKAANEIYSDPLYKAFIRAGDELIFLQAGVNTALYAFAQAFVHVIEQWKKTDAQAANRIVFDFDKPDLNAMSLTIYIAPIPAQKLHVDIVRVRQIINYIEDYKGKMKRHFEEMDVAIQDSVHFWRGHSGDQTRQNWKRHLHPLMEKTDKTIYKIVDFMTDELHAIIKRDAANQPGR